MVELALMEVGWWGGGDELQTGWLRRGCTSAQRCLCQGNDPDDAPSAGGAVCSQGASATIDGALRRRRGSSLRERWCRLGSALEVSGGPGEPLG